MLKSLQLTNFRGLEKLELKQLKRVNLIVGDNNTGKTSILEALYLLLGKPSQLREFAASFRATESEGLPVAEKPFEDTIERFWMWLSRDHNPLNPFSVSADIGSGAAIRVDSRLDTPQNSENRSFTVWRHMGALEAPILQVVGYRDVGFVDQWQMPIRVSKLSVRPSNPVHDAELFNQVTNRSGGEESAEAFMRKVEQRLRKLRYRKLRQNSDAVVYAELGNLPEFIPSTQLGQAFTRMLHIYCEVKLERAGVLLADEIENGIYFANLLPFWSTLMELVTDQASQLFATTHSFECLKAAHEAACMAADEGGGEYNLNIIRLDRMEWGVKATEFGRAEMEAAIANGWEMR